MKTTDIDRILTKAEKVLLVFLLIFITSMLISPWIQGKGSWRYLQETWERWQTLNAAVLALTSSVIALYIAKYHEEKKRERDLAASTAFLLFTLSDLTAYCKNCSGLLREAYNAADSNEHRLYQLKTELEEIPESLRETFGRCISVADPQVAGHLETILVKLQINHARLRELKNISPRTPTDFGRKIP